MDVVFCDICCMFVSGVGGWWGEYGVMVDRLCGELVGSGLAVGGGGRWVCMDLGVLGWGLGG